MDRAPTLALRYDAEPALDARGLFLAGLEHLRRLAGRTWTDHNLHDPGITMLELLAYALTELSYRAQFPVADLVAGPAAARQFWRARDALPCEPLSAADYRRLLIDLPGVKNAWLLPHLLTVYADTRRRELRRTDPGTPGVRAVALRGLFDVRLDFMDDRDTADQRAEVIDAVRRTLARHRNLCQEFVDVTEVRTIELAVCAEVELQRDADAHAVGAAIMMAWRASLAPPVPNHSLADRLAEGLDAPSVFEGPSLTMGFIDDGDLKASELPAEVRLSDLIAATMRVDGVAAVRDLTANALDDQGQALPLVEAWRVPLPAGTRARLAATAGRLVLHKRGVPVLAWSFNAVPPSVVRALAALQDAARRKVETARADDLPLPQGRDRALASYVSVQRDFPAIYGLADKPLPDSASALRRAQAMQLAGYLLLFEQWLTNLCAQLAAAPDMLSVEPAHLQALRESFEAEPVAARREWRHQRAQRVGAGPQAGGLPQADALYAAALTDAALAAALERRAEAAVRWQANLDHLLARVGEDFGAYLDVMAGAFGASDAQAIGDRCRFLSEAGALARERGLAHDASAAAASLWNSVNVSGLERRLARLLGIVRSERRDLALPAFDDRAEVDADAGGEFHFRVRERLTDRVLLRSSSGHATREAAQAALAKAIERAQQAAAYLRAASTAGHLFSIVDEGGAVLALSDERFADEVALAHAIDSLIRTVCIHYGGEGMHCIEGLALRLVDDDDRALVCVDPDCADCADDDPFSYRLHFVLPAYAGRFQDAAFRDFAEQTIREQTPAHLLPKVCWVDRDDMTAVDAAYRAWITLPEGAASAARREATAALRDVLARAKNIHPARRLFDCTTDEEKPYFVLGRSALGTEAR
jgi:hypothetical protein